MERDVVVAAAADEEEVSGRWGGGGGGGLLEEEEAVKAAKTANVVSSRGSGIRRYQISYPLSNMTYPYLDYVDIHM